MLEPVERAGDRRRRAELGLDDDDVLRGGRADAELLEHGVQRLARVAPRAAAGHDVARTARARRSSSRGRSSRMSRETVACVTGQPAFASASASSSWLPIRCRVTTLAISRCRSAFASGRVSGSTGVTVTPRFGRVTVRQRSGHAAQAALDRSLRGPRRGRDDGRASRRVPALARRDRRGAAGEEMTKADLARRARRRAPAAARRPGRRSRRRRRRVARRGAAQRRGLPAQAEAEPDQGPRARATRRPTRSRPRPAAVADGPQLGSRPKQAKKNKKRKGGKGPAPLLVVGAALVAGDRARQGHRLERPCTPPRLSTRAPGLGATVKSVAERASSLVRLELELAALELKRKVSSLAIGIGLALGAAVLLVFALGFGLATIAAGIATAVAVVARAADRDRRASCSSPACSGSLGAAGDQEGHAAGAGAGDRGGEADDARR